MILGYLQDGEDLVLLAMNGWDEGDPALDALAARRSTGTPVVVLEPGARTGGWGPRG